MRRTKPIPLLLSTVLLMISFILLSSCGGHVLPHGDPDSTRTPGYPRPPTTSTTDPFQNLNQTNVPNTQTQVSVKIAAGRANTFVIMDDGLWACGTNPGLGDGTMLDRRTLIKISPDKWSVVSGGFSHTIGIKADGTLWAWGNNIDGQLGDGTFGYQDEDTPKRRLVPTKIGTDTDWLKIAAGSSHNVALKKDGTLWSWGSNTKGQLGDGTFNNIKIVPTKIGTDKSWVDIAAGSDSTFALKADGTIWGWGNDDAGQLGLPLPRFDKPYSVPTQIGNDTDWVQIEAGLAMKKNGTIWVWGKGVSDEPISVTGAGWVKVSIGGHVMALHSSGTLYAWGANDSGQLGIGPTKATDQGMPTPVSGTDWVDVAAGGSHTVAVKRDGSVWAWGSNSYGQLGTGQQWSGSGDNINKPTMILK